MNVAATVGSGGGNVLARQCDGKIRAQERTTEGCVSAECGVTRRWLTPH
jgi:hypothetical protein